MSVADIPPLPPVGPGVATDSIWSRLSDRLNPILVREVQQAVKGRVFALTIILALSISVMIAAVVASEYQEGNSGRGAFDAGLATLIPLMLFVIPMQAYNSMRTELKGGIVEQLLLTRLSPSRVIAGKLQAAMVQFVLYVSVLSPLIATSYLLRGVDLPTIALSLVFMLLVCIAATAFAVSSAAQAILPALQTMASLGIAFGLGFGTVLMIGFVASGTYSRGIGDLVRSDSLVLVSSAVIGVTILVTTLSWLAARTFLLHAFENKSTAFRVFLWSLPVVLFGWMLLFVDSADFRYWFPALCMLLLIVGVIFGVFMVTEQGSMSPRVLAHVPSNPLKARCLAMFLPGRDRGMLCFVAYMVFLIGLAALIWPVVMPPPRATAWVGGVGLMIAAYAVVYLGIGRWLRSRLPDTVQGNHAGRFVLPLILFMFCLLPLLADVLFQGSARRWHVGHIMNPFWTIERFEGEGEQVWWACIATLLVGVLLHVFVFSRGLRAVRDASVANRRRLQPSPAAAGASEPVDGE